MASSLWALPFQQPLYSGHDHMLGVDWSDGWLTKQVGPRKHWQKFLRRTERQRRPIPFSQQTASFQENKRIKRCPSVSSRSKSLRKLTATLKRETGQDCGSRKKSVAMWLVLTHEFLCMANCGVPWTYKTPSYGDERQQEYQTIIAWCCL